MSRASPIAAGSPLERLLSAPMGPGRLVWIGVRPQRRAPVVSCRSVRLTEAGGLEGDHYSTRGAGKRQVTLIQAEHVRAVASYLGREAVPFELLRRNLVVEGINLLALKDRQFEIGSVLLMYTGLCHPCSRMEANLGVGGYNAMRGHGGITATVLSPGTIRVGDRVGVCAEPFGEGP